MDSNSIQSDKNMKSADIDIKRWLRKYIFTTENLFCLVGFLLSLGGYYFTDFDFFQNMNIVIAFVFVAYTFFCYCAKVISTEYKTDILKPLLLPLVIFLILFRIL